MFPMSCFKFNSSLQLWEWTCCMRSQYVLTLTLLKSENPYSPKLPHKGKLAVWAMFFPFKEHKPYQGTLGSLEVILIGSRIRPSPSMDPTGTLKWTSWFSRKIQAKIPFVHSTLSSPPKTFWNTFWSLWNCTRAQRTLLDHHGPPNGPQNGSCEANFGGPLVKKGPPGPLHGPNWSIFLDRPLDNSKT